MGTPILSPHEGANKLVGAVAKYLNSQGEWEDLGIRLRALKSFLKNGPAGSMICQLPKEDLDYIMSRLKNLPAIPVWIKIRYGVVV